MIQDRTLQSPIESIHFNMDLGITSPWERSEEIENKKENGNKSVRVKNLLDWVEVVW